MIGAATRLREARTQATNDLESRKKAIETLLAPMAKTPAISLLVELARQAARDARASFLSSPGRKTCSPLG